MKDITDNIPDECCGLLVSSRDLLRERDATNVVIEAARSALIDIEKRCDLIDKDCHEGDKVMCGTQEIRLIIAKAYPKYKRQTYDEDVTTNA